MKNIKKRLALFLVLVLALSMFAGCGKPADESIQRTPEEQILWDRREAAEAYLRTLASTRWRADTDVSYNHNPLKPDKWHIVAGRLYEGLPYSFSGASLGAWLDHPNTVDEKGIHNMEGLTKALLHGGSGTARLGIDCSGTLSHSWQAVGAQVRTESTNAMTPTNGYLRVGEYEAPEDEYINTITHCKENGTDVIYEAYSQLQKADGIVNQSGGGGHARFVVGINVVRNKDGSIDGNKSTVTTIEQFGLMEREEHYFDETVGEDVYPCITVDEKYTFAGLYMSGYLPVTNKVFVDPSPIAEPVVTDTLKNPSLSNLFSGTIKCSWALDNVTITITDASGAEVQSSILHPQRRTELSVSMSQFTKDAAENKTVGVVSPLALPSGSYHCKVTCRTVAGHVLTAREFDFTM